MGSISAPTTTAAKTTETPPETSNHSGESMKLAIAMALLRSKLLSKSQPSFSSSSLSSAARTPHSDALRWKQKAKERKQEILKLKQELKEAESSNSLSQFSEFYAKFHCSFNCCSFTTY